MINFLEGIKNLLTDEILEKAASLIGIDTKTTSSAIETFLPAIIGRLANMGSNSSGAVALLDLFKSKKLGGTDLKDLTSTLSNKEKSSNFLQLGGQLVETIFGRSQNTLLDKLIQMTGIKKAGGSMLMKFLLPVVLKELGGLALDNNWGASKLSSYLINQGKLVSPVADAFSSIPGFGDEKNKVSSSTSNDSSSNSNIIKNNRGMGWLKWLLPILLALGVYFLTKNGCNTKSINNSEEEKVVSTKTSSSSGIAKPHSVNDDTKQNNSGHTDEAKDDIRSVGDYSKYTVSTNGDIVDGNGKIIHPNESYYLSNDGNILTSSGATLITKNNLPKDLLSKIKSYLGKYSSVKLDIDANGNLIDSSGKMLYKTGEFNQKNGFYYDKEGNKLGRMWKKTFSTVNNNSKETTKGDTKKGSEEIKSFFSDLISKKLDIKTSYILSNVTFNPEDHKITNYSKTEIESLAQALKINKNAKIVIKAYSANTGSSKASKKLTKKRAEVIYNMLVTLGVDKSQLSFKGMGMSQEATTDFIKIVVK